MKLLSNQILVPVKAMPNRPAALRPHPVGGEGDLDGGLGGAPIALGGGVTVSQGLSQQIDEQSLGLGFRTGYYIDEIRVSAYTAQRNALHFWTGLAQLVQLKFECGPHAFSPQEPMGVPMGLLGPRYNGDTGSAAENLIGSVGRDFARVRWVLPKPLYMPPGDVLRCTVFNIANAAALGGQPDMTVNVAYVGRAIPQGTKPPLTRQVPWLGFAQNFFTNTNTFFQTQGEGDFKNPFAKRVIVHRFTERSVLYDGSSWLDYTVAGSPAGTFIEVRMDDSLGYAIVPQFMPLGPVFDEQSRGAWTFSRALGPHEQFNLQMRLNGTFAGNNKYNVQVGAVGYRDEEI